MPRIDIELTSSQSDGTWTWRAAGARQPKGVVAASVLHDGAKVGDVVKAEADFDLDGINVTSVIAPKAKKSGAERLELLGSGKEEALVTHSPLKPEREGGDRGRRGGDRGDRGDRFGPGGPGGRSAGPPSRPRATPGPGARDGARRDQGAPPRPESRERARPERPERPRSERPERAGGERPGGERERPGGERPGGGQARRDRSGAERPRGDRPAGDRPSRDRPARPAATGGPGAGSGRPARPQAKRLQAGRAHRDAVLEGLPPEQRAIAEQVLRGGMAGVRQAVEEQNAQARAAGDPEIRADALLGLAEELLPRLRAAEWRDRADAAAAHVDDISLRDLRTVVAGADAAGRDEESRALASRLREGLDRRSAAERQAWVDEMTTCLAEGRVVRALRVSGRAPEQGLRFPTELTAALSQAVGEAMSPDTAADRWLALLEAVLASPVRRTIQPRGLPADGAGEVLTAVRAAVSKVPGLGPLVGETSGQRPVPPPPRPRPAPPAAHAPPAAPADTPPPPPVPGEPDVGDVAAALDAAAPAGSADAAATGAASAEGA